MVNMLICGMPYIILEGNLKDWEEIHEKLNFLKKYDFPCENIEEDLIEIINTKKGEINLNFWRNIMMETRETAIERGDGCIPQKVVIEMDFIKGWFLHFYGYERVKKDQLNTIMKEVVAAPLIIREPNEQKEAAIFAGIMDIKQDPNTFEVEPIINYYLALKGDPKYVEPEKFDEQENTDLYPKELFINNEKVINNKDEAKAKKDPFVDPFNYPLNGPIKDPFDSDAI